MRKIIAIIILVICGILNIYADKYDVKNIFYKERVEYDTRAIDNYGNIKEIDYILRPTQIDEGKYTVKLTRVDTNIYKIDGTDFYIETQFCYEYCYSEEVLLIIHNYADRSFGIVVFYD